MSYLQQKVELEHLWTELYKKNGIYTADMIPLTVKIKELTRKIILEYQKKIKQRFHNQVK